MDTIHPTQAGTNTPITSASLTRCPGHASRIPWFCWATILGGLCLTVGILWDISWHSTIGRDTFFTPAHIAVYLGGSLGGMVCGWLVLQATLLQRDAYRERTVSVLGFRGPIGAWVVIWGASAMLVSAPFDDWWHNAYGLDVRILSPPHVLLALGMYQVVLGASMMAWSWMNNLSDTDRSRFNWFLTAAGGIQLTLASMLILEISVPNRQHSPIFVFASALLFPGILASVARNSYTRWPATQVALAYFFLFELMGLVLPLFPAEPKLAPILTRVTHMVPPMFPLLLFIPSLGMDWVYGRLGRGRGWKRDLAAAGLCGITFITLYIPTQWFASQFLLSPMADNAFFHGHGRYFGYSTSPGNFRFEFWNRREPTIHFQTWVWGTAMAAASSWIGISIGNFLARIRR